MRGQIYLRNDELMPEQMPAHAREPTAYQLFDALRNEIEKLKEEIRQQKHSQSVIQMQTVRQATSTSYKKPIFTVHKNDKDTEYMVNYKELLKMLLLVYIVMRVLDAVIFRLVFCRKSSS